jgi:diguanylate cyclase (GGDEF)-like protein
MADVQYAVDNLDATIRSLEGLSETDHLTGLYNRRAGEQRLAEDIARVKRGGGVLTVCVVDVNDFKSINDTYGHQAGDVCIQHVAVVIRRNIRESDWLARWGGDEFVLALHDASPFAATDLVLQRIVRDLKESPVRLPAEGQGGKLVLTVTVGARRYSGEEDLQDLLGKADEVMYEAKREGRPWILRR